MIRLWTRTVLGLLAVVLAGVLPLDAQQVTATRLFKMTITIVEEDSETSATIPEGDVFKVSINRGSTFELIPVQVGAGRYSVSVYQQTATGRVRAETLSMGLNAAARTKTTKPTFVVEINEVRNTSARTSFQAPRSEGSAAFVSNPRDLMRLVMDIGTCCVKCGNVEACGCAVSMDCGRCCSDACCENIPDGLAFIDTQPKTFMEIAGLACRKANPSHTAQPAPSPVGSRSRLAVATSTR